MDEITLYERVLYLSAPWRVDYVELDSRTNCVNVHVSADEDVELRCPRCHTVCTRYDSRHRSWRHLDTCQFETRVHAEIPRIDCDVHGVLQLAVPWAESNSRYTALFEAYVISWLKEASINAVARRTGLSWNAIDGIMQRAVERGLARRRRRPAEHIAVDEICSKKGHEYVTIVSDDLGMVLGVFDDRSKNSLLSYYQQLTDKDRSAIKTVSMDMSQAYIAATKEALDQWKEAICFDRFHVQQDLNKAVNEVRQSELRHLPAEFKGPMQRSRFSWLRSEATLQEKHIEQMRHLEKVAVKTARAWSICQYARSLWDYQSRYWAERAWLKWHGRAIRSRLQPIKTAATSIKKNLWGIVNAIIHKRSNALAESINGRIKRLKIQAKGFRNKDRFKRAILFNFGGLSLYPKTAPT